MTPTTPEAAKAIPEDIREMIDIILEASVHVGRHVSTQELMVNAMLAERERYRNAAIALCNAERFFDHLRNSLEVCHHTEELIAQVKRSVASLPQDLKAEA